MSKSRPTDLELMQFFDGELEEPRRTEVQTFVLASPSAQSKLHGLDEVGAWLRTSSSTAHDPFADDDLASRVLGLATAQAADGSREGSPRAATPEGAPRLEGASGPKPAPAAQPTQPANDNARRIFALAGLAAAAAAALFVWGRGASTDRQETARSSPSGVDTSVLVAPSSTGPVVASADTSVPGPGDTPSDGGVEVASVEFGKRSGAIFHVPTDVRGATTTVLWLSDE